MRLSMIRPLLHGINYYKNISHYRTITRFNHVKEIKPIRTAHSMTQTDVLSTTDEHSAMMAIWPELVMDLTGGGIYPDLPAVRKWMAEILQYNVSCGKNNRGLSVIYTYRMLTHPNRLTDENLKLARVLAWCYEINEACLLMQDDLMDGAITRRGQLCWYRHDNIGVTAVNDSILLEHTLYQLLKTYFNKHECYTNLFETFTEISLQIAMGQALDIFTSRRLNGNKPNMDLFTIDQYNLTTRYRGSLYFYRGPVKVAMYFAGITDPEIYRQVEPILLDLGHLYLVQNDYLDIYGDPDVIGQSGTDIQNGKCSWLIVTALRHANPAQKEILQECYGCEDPEKMARVKQVYDDLELPAKYADYLEKAYNTINIRKDQMTCDFPKDLFDAMIALGYS